MTKPKIKFKLVKFERALVFQVLEMDERFRNKHEDGSINFKSKKSLNIISLDGPAIFEDRIYLRGRFDMFDFDVGHMPFESNTKRDEYYNQVLEALKDWAENWQGWNEPAQNQQPDEPDVFVF